MKRKALSLLISIVFVLGIVPSVPLMAEDTEPPTHTVTFVTDGFRVVEGEGIVQNDDGNYVMYVEDGATINAPTSPIQEYVTVDPEIDPTPHFWCWIDKPSSEVTSMEDFNESQSFIFADDPNLRTATPITEDITLYACFFGVYEVEVFDLTSSERLVGGNLIFNSSLFNDSSVIKSTWSSVLWGSKVNVETYPDEGYSFVGWSTTTSRDDIVSKSQDFPSAYTTCTTGEVWLYALYEEEHNVTINIHFGTINNTDEIEPLSLSVSSGATINDIESSTEFKTAYESFIQLGFNSEMITTSLKPINNYASYTAVDEDALNAYDSISENIDIYYTALLPIESITFTVDPQISGISSETSPSILFDNDNIRISSDENGDSQTCWLTSDDSHERYVGVFEEGKKYDANCTIEAQIGYYFALLDTDIKVDTGTLVRFEGTDFSKNLIIEIEAITPDTYSCANGDEQTVIINDETSAEFRFTSSGDDSKTFDNMIGYDVDGEAVPTTITTEDGKILPASGATVGSVIISLYPAYLETLNEGEHILTVYFKNGNTASATFRVTKTATVANSSASIPETGESNNNTMLVGIIFIIIAFLGIKTYSVIKNKQGINK